MKKSTWRLTVLELALMVGVAVCLVSGAAALGNQEILAEKVVRLHVLANSDSQEDQALKLQVRDRVLALAETALTQAPDREHARAVLAAALPELKAAAEEEIAANGYAYPVTVRLENAQFPTRTYDGFSLPAGQYLALRVLIGEAKGKNWWCVVFPPLCAAASSDVALTAMAAGLTEEETKLITEESSGYVLKFKAVEWWESLRERLG